jgi:hypothetical protein
LALDEIKKAIGNVTECILNIADVIVKSQNGTDDKETNTDANIDEENLVVTNKTDDNLMNKMRKMLVTRPMNHWHPLMKLFQSYPMTRHF